MEQRHLKFAVFGMINQEKSTHAVAKVFESLYAHGAEVYVDRPFYESLPTELRAEVHADGVFEGHNFEADFVLSLGGDGTFLRVASRVGAKQTPILGVNLGRLGFLADVLPSELGDALDALYAGNFVTEEHSVIQIETEGGTIGGSPYALNDIAILKRDNAAMIQIRTCIDGEYLVTYQADGLIVSTPTGSTAYSLSNGGPIITPQSGNLCLTPVAPHSLNIRPIVLGDNSVITLTVSSRSHNYLIAIDGRSEKMLDTTTVTIRKAPHTVKMVKKNGLRYFATLREKMMWGADQRG